MDSSIIISIIIPVYNMEKYLPECIASLDRQDFDDTVEIIFIDDGSFDKSAVILDEYSSFHDNVYVYHQENSGVSSARNKGLEKAKGKYIAWIDPDDYITDDWWETIKKELSAEPEMLCFDMYILEDGKVTDFEFDSMSRTIPHQELCEQLALGTRIKSHLCSKIILRSLFKQSFSTKYSYCEDFALLHHVVYKVRKCRYIHKSLYVYRQIKTSIVHNESKLLDNYRLGITLYKKRYRFFRKKGIMVPWVGIYLAMLVYCNEYVKHSSEVLSLEHKRVYQICKKMICKKCFSIAKSKYLGIREKIKLVMTIID